MNTDAMSLVQLQDFLLLHFVQGELIFTDGNKPSGFFETARVDEASTPFSTIYTKIKIETGIDKITIPAKNGDAAVVVNESAKTNVLTGRSLSTSGQQSIFPNSLNNGVIHEIKKPLVFDLVDTQ
jgi:hypothetical protein